MKSMTSLAIDDIVKDRFNSLDMVGIYSADCHKIEAMIAKHLSYKEYQCYWKLNTLPHQQQGILIVDHLGREESFKKYMSLFDALIDLGWKALTPDNFYDLGKDFPFSKEITIGGVKHSLKLMLRAFIATDSPFCKKVKVGVEDKFDIVCTDH